MKCLTLVTLTAMIVVVKSMPKNNITYINDITKSPGDKRLYRGLVLPNQLRVLLVSNPEASKSGATLLVGVGFLSDPDELQGLAHFCEHMLFLGSEKYPIEKTYDKLINDHGGFSNAMTASDYTIYYFSIASEQFEKALDVFAQFFISPLMAEDSADREVNAVDSEFQGRKMDDTMRLEQLQKSLSKDGHSMRKLPVGNKMTLDIIPKEKGIDVRKELLKFHDKWYSANIMTLVVSGNVSLEKLEEMIVPIFSGIKNKNVTRPEWRDHPYGPDQVGSKLYFVPVVDMKALFIMFPLPDLREYYKTKPVKYISRLINDKRPGSLFSVLKARALANALHAHEEESLKAKGFGFFTIAVGPTSYDLDKLHEIITLIFQYLNMLRESGTQKWIFDEFQKISETKFRFDDFESSTGQFAEDLHNYEFSFEEILSGSQLIKDYRPDVINMVLDYLKPSNVLVTIHGKKFEDVADKVEPWYGSKYKFEKIPKDVIRKWENCGVNSEFKLLAPNEFIPTNFDILSRKDSGSPHPLIIYENNFTRVWFKEDDKFLIPKANLEILIVSPVTYSDAFHKFLTKMFDQLIKEALREYKSAAEFAGLSYDIEVKYFGLSVNVKGFNDKLNVLLDKILEKMTDLRTDSKNFDATKERIMTYFNFDRASNPLSDFWDNFFSAYLEKHWTEDEFSKVAARITVDDMNQFVPRFFSKIFVECLIHGNVDEEGANSFIEILERRLISKINEPLSPEELSRPGEIKLSEGECSILEAESQLSTDSCTGIYYQIGGLSTENSMKTELLKQLAKQPTYYTLRTKEQLGYHVGSTHERYFSSQGFLIMVKSEKHPKFLDSRIEAFLIQFRKLIQEMSDEEFEQNKEAVATKRLAKPKTLTDLSSKFWDEIVYRRYNFGRDEVEVAYLRTITKTDFLKFFDDHIKEGGSKRKKLSVHIVSMAKGGAGTLPGTDFVFSNESAVQCRKVEDIRLFKKSHGFYSLPKLYVEKSLYKTKKLRTDKLDHDLCKKSYSTSVMQLICRIFLN